MLNEELAKKLSSKVILVIDDQNSIRNVVKSYFRDFGFDRVETAIDGQDGLNFLMQNAVDIVICDWQMPKISGIELLKLIRASKDAASLPFLMITSTSDVSAVKDAMKSGVSDYMIKPFKPAQLGFKVVQLLSKSTHQAKKLPVNITKLESKTEEDKTTSKSQNPSNSNSDKKDDFDGEPVEVETLI